MPDRAVNLHTTVGQEQSWSRVIPINPSELPDGMENHPLVLRHTAEVVEEASSPTSIIIPTCKSQRLIEPLLREINRRSTGHHEVIATCLEGKSAAVNRNYGLGHALYPRIIMVDDDILHLPHGWNQRLIRPLRDPAVAMVSARLMKPDGQVGTLMGKAPFEPGRLTLATEHKLATACVAFRKSSLRFDEGFIGSGFEDDDMCRQMLAAQPGARFLVDNGLMVTHLNEMKNQKGEIWDKNKAYFERKWAGK